MNTVKKRDNSFDIVKGCLIILVVLGHGIQRYDSIPEGGWSLNPLFMLIYTFHMPLFVFVSGYFSYSALCKPFKEVVLNKTKRLYSPCIFYSFLNVLLLIVIGKYAFNPDLVGQPMLKQIFKSVYGLLKGYWYLDCILVLTISFHIIHRKCINKYVGGVIYVILFFLYDDLPYYLFKDCQLIRMAPIFCLGLIYKKHQGSVENFVIMKWKELIILSILFIICIRYVYGWDIIQYNLGARIIDGVMCSFISFMIIKYCCKFKFIQNFSAILWLGRYSLPIYCIHCLLYHILYMQYTNNVCFNILIFTISLLFSSVLVTKALIYKVPEKLKFIVGL